MKVLENVSTGFWQGVGGILAAGLLAILALLKEPMLESLQYLLERIEKTGKGELLIVALVFLSVLLGLVCVRLIQIYSYRKAENEWKKLSDPEELKRIRKENEAERHRINSAFENL